MTATKIKTKKIDEVHPPAEIRDNTKARRAWIAAEIARIAAQPNRSAKSVGQGSYQHVSVYEVTEVAGRLRYRGHCQCCGATQVVVDGLLVLHGYSRPGDGWAHGRCPGVQHQPLEFSKTLTEGWLTSTRDSLAAAIVERDAAKIAERETGRAWHDADEPRQFAPPRVRRNASHDERVVYEAALARWEAAHPLSAAHDRATSRAQQATQLAWQLEQQVRHFEFWLAAGVHGTPLTEEVVA